MFLEIAPVVSAYSFETPASVAGTDWLGKKFSKQLLQPLPLAALLSLVQAGWPADAVLGVGA
jgi:hypothetical protein